MNFHDCFQTFGVHCIWHSTNVVTKSIGKTQDCSLPRWNGRKKKNNTIFSEFKNVFYNVKMITDKNGCRVMKKIAEDERTYSLTWFILMKKYEHDFKE